jgi:hypothetical protein
MNIEELSRKVDELTCRLDCQTAVINFFGALDRKDEALWATTLTDDAKQHSPRHPGGALNMKDHWKMYKSHTDFFPTHILTNFVITPTGPDTAEGRMHGTAWNTKGASTDTLPRPMLDKPSRIGLTLLKFRKTDTGWRISDFIGNPPYLDCGRT